MGARIYFDHAATTPLDPRVAAAMRPFLGGVFGNPSSMHRDGRRARAAVDAARGRAAALLNADPSTIIFTAGGTEADNLALIGVAETFLPGPCHLITSAFEHPAVLASCRYLEARGAEVTYLPVSGDGLVSPEDLAAALRPSTRLISLMAANNVVGTLQPLGELAQVARSAGVLFHTDAVQAAGKIPLEVDGLPADLVSLSSHKIHGPKGAGALYVRKGVKLAPMVHGGGQESGRRSGTENVAGVVGFGVAAALARADMAEETKRVVALRDRLIDGVLAAVPAAYLIGHRRRRLPGHACFGFAGREAEAVKILLALDDAGVSASAGSACSASHAAEPSYVLTAMGFDPVKARGSLRVTLGRFNTEAEVDNFLEILPRVAASLRSTGDRPQAQTCAS